MQKQILLVDASSGTYAPQLFVRNFAHLLTDTSRKVLEFELNDWMSVRTISLN